MSLADDLERFAGKSRLNLRELVIGVVNDLAREVVMATPVATGRARGNWICSLNGETAGNEMREPDRNGNRTLNEIAAALSALETGETEQIRLTNSLPYILALENGSSSQAPNGMMRLAAMHFPEIVRRNISKLAG